MRITNSMITNGLLLDINRNAIGVNKYYGQLSTGKKIQVPSDDPLSASRALKFRTNVSETEQYLKNVSQGLSWMEVTEAALRNINEILISIRDLQERNATDSLTYEDRDKIKTDVASLIEQLGQEMNVTYAGRYVFSGYRTDQPPIITKDSPELVYRNITQTFEPKDVEYKTVYWKDTSPSSTEGLISHEKEIAVIKLAYTGLTNTELADNGLIYVGNGAGQVPIESVSLYECERLGIDPYKPGNYIRETGELVLAASDVAGTSRNGVLGMNYNDIDDVFSDIKGLLPLNPGGGTQHYYIDGTHNFNLDYFLSARGFDTFINGITGVPPGQLSQAQRDEFALILQDAIQDGVDRTATTSVGAILPYDVNITVGYDTSGGLFITAHDEYGVELSVCIDFSFSVPGTFSYNFFRNFFEYDLITDSSALVSVVEDTYTNGQGIPPLSTQPPNQTMPSSITYHILSERDGGRGGLKKGELNPQVYGFGATDDTTGSPTQGKIFNAGEQHFELEFSVNTRIRINANALPIFSDKMYVDFQAMNAIVGYQNDYSKEQLIDMYKHRINPDTGDYYEGEALEDIVAKEMQNQQMSLQSLLSNNLGRCDEYISLISKEHTDLGSRMSRLELIEKRLKDDRINYTRLMSDNEDVDYSEAMMRLSSLQAVYQASLKTGAGIMQLTLANYI